MAASLRTGIRSLAQGIHTFAQSAASLSATQVCSLPGKLPCFGNNILSRFTRTKYGPLSTISARWIGFSSLSKTHGLPLQPVTPLLDQVRTKVRFNREKGEPEAVEDVPARFFRLNWGIWIRTRAGRKKRLWRKTSARKYRLRQHVFCNKTQSKLLDKMVTDYWKRPKYYVDDPYEPYHKRENFEQFYLPRSRPFFP